MRSVYDLPEVPPFATMWMWKSAGEGTVRSAAPQDFDYVEIFINGHMQRGVRIPPRFGVVTDQQEQICIVAQDVMRLIEQAYDAGIAEGKRQVRAALGVEGG